MRAVELDIPRGYEIDEKKSTSKKIVLKRLKRYTVTSTLNIREVEEIESPIIEFYSEEDAEKFILLCKLIQMMNIYNNGWVPDPDSINYVIMLNGKSPYLDVCSSKHIFTFQSSELRNQFYDNFKSELKQVASLLYDR